jgi:hypothetical protein
MINLHHDNPVLRNETHRFRILFALVLIAAIAGIAFLAFNAGVAHGTAIQAPTAQNEQPSISSLRRTLLVSFPNLRI